MLPIYLPQFEWNSLEKKLITLANKEKEDLEPKDRDVHKVHIRHFLLVFFHGLYF